MSEMQEPTILVIYHPAHEAGSVRHSPAVRHRVNNGAMSVAVLDRPVYGMSQVDRLLGVPAGTARRWIDGYERAGKRYPPVIRTDPTGDDVVKWGEFVEAQLLAGYRDKGVPLQRMRPAIQRMREEFGVPYPLAHFRPLVQGRELVQEIQDEVNLDRALRLVIVLRNGQLAWSPETEEFVEKLDFGTGGEVVRLRPLGKGSPVQLDPSRAFGMPTVRSVTTETIAEEFRTGSAPEQIAEDYALDLDDVHAALRYEMPAA